ncbi:MAG: hypothetical protein AAF713_02945 [Pseudomonadota bacterium]
MKSALHWSRKNGAHEHFLANMDQIGVAKMHWNSPLKRDNRFNRVEERFSGSLSSVRVSDNHSLGDPSPGRLADPAPLLDAGADMAELGGAHAALERLRATAGLRREPARQIVLFPAHPGRPTGRVIRHG